MELTMKKQTPAQHEDNNILRMLDRGIDDMEAGREFPKNYRIERCQTKCTIIKLF